MSAVVGLRSERVVTPSGVRPATVVVENGRILALGNAKHLVVSLYALLAQVKDPAPALVAARDELLATLGAL